MSHPQQPQQHQFQRSQIHSVISLNSIRTDSGTQVEALTSSKDPVMELLAQAMAFLETLTESLVTAMVSEDHTMESMETQILLMAIKTLLLEMVTKFYQAAPYHKEKEATSDSTEKTLI